MPLHPGSKLPAFVRHGTNVPYTFDRGFPVYVLGPRSASQADAYAQLVERHCTGAQTLAGAEPVRTRVALWVMDVQNGVARALLADRYDRSQFTLGERFREEAERAWEDTDYIPDLLQPGDTFLLRPESRERRRSRTSAFGHRFLLDRDADAQGLPERFPAEVVAVRRVHTRDTGEPMYVAYYKPVPSQTDAKPAVQKGAVFDVELAEDEWGSFARLPVGPGYWLEVLRSEGVITGRRDVRVLYTDPVAARIELP